MTKEQTTKLMATFRAAYPTYYKGVTTADAQVAVNLWQSLLAEYPESLVAQAAMAVIACNKFPPAPAELLEKIRLLTQPPIMSEGEAWEMVRRAISNAGYHAAEEFERLPVEIQSAVGSPAMLHEWSMVDTATLQTVTQSNFMRSYRERAAYTREYQAIPKSVRESIAQLSQCVRGLPDAAGLKAIGGHKGD